jgi:hypothetical protein
MAIGWKSGTSTGLLFMKGSDLRIGSQARVELAVPDVERGDCSGIAAQRIR